MLSPPYRRSEAAPRGIAHAPTTVGISRLHAPRTREQLPLLYGMLIASPARHGCLPGLTAGPSIVFSIFIRKEASVTLQNPPCSNYRLPTASLLLRVEHQESCAIIYSKQDQHQALRRKLHFFFCILPQSNPEIVASVSNPRCLFRLAPRRRSLVPAITLYARRFLIPPLPFYS